MSEWKRMRFRNGKVWVRVDEHGALLLTDGKASIVYKQDDTRVYTASPQSLHELDDPAPSSTVPEKTKKPNAKQREPKHVGAAQQTKASIQGETNAFPSDPNVLEIWTDGACSGNPGEAGAGVVLKYKEHRKELSHYLGKATNNIAELTAIFLGLSEVKNRRLPIRIFTDSSYSIGVLTKDWKAKANQELIEEIRALTREFPRLSFVKVEGHAGIEENERVDELARLAITAKKHQTFTKD